MRQRREKQARWPQAVLGALVLLSLPQLATAAKPPNILFIYIDDLGWRDAGFMGSDFYETPHIDALAERFGPTLRTIYATKASTKAAVLASDLVIGAVLVRGARAPKLVTAEMVREMRRGSVIVDVAIDQGGCVETARPTTHADPTYVVDGVVHYCVANMPGAVPRTSTQALNNATLPYLINLADQGTTAALLADEGLRAGLTIHHGSVTEPAVAEALDRPYVSPEEALT